MQSSADSGAKVRDMNGGHAQPALSASTPPEKPRRGRPKGIARVPGSGRKKGTPNKATQVGREFIIKKSSSLPFLCDVSAGRMVSVADPTNPRKKIKIYPSFTDRLRAAQTLAPMVVPTLKATELTGKDGAPVALTLLDFLRGLPE